MKTGILSRSIPQSIAAAMKAPDSLDIGWARNYNSVAGLHPEYPGWNQMRELLPFSEVLAILNRRVEHPIQATDWEGLAQFQHRFPIIEELMLMLANATGKTVWVTQVGAMEMDEWTEINILRIAPCGSAIWVKV